MVSLQMVSLLIVPVNSGIANSVSPNDVITKGSGNGFSELVSTNGFTVNGAPNGFTATGGAVNCAC